MVQIWSESNYESNESSFSRKFHCYGSETDNWCINKPIPLLSQTNVTYDNYISDTDYESYISDTYMNVNWAWAKPIGDVGYVYDSASSIKCTCAVEFDSIEYDIPEQTLTTPWVFTSDFEESSGRFTY